MKHNISDKSPGKPGKTTFSKVSEAAGVLTFKCEVASPPEVAAFYTITWYVGSTPAKEEALSMGTKTKDITSTALKQDLAGTEVSFARC